MLKVLSTNFGADASAISFRYSGDSRFITLNGQFTVDASLDEFKMQGVLRLTVAQLPFTRSHDAAVFFINTNSGAHDITISKAWIENGNTICILPVVEYENLASYDIFFLTTFIPENLSGSHHTFAPGAEITPTVLRGAASNLTVVTFNGVLWQAMVIMADSLTFDETEEDVKIDLQGYPSANFDFLPIIYTDSVSNTYGSNFIRPLSRTAS